MGVRVWLQVYLEFPVVAWFLAVGCAKIEVVVVFFREEPARVCLWALEYLLVDREVCLSQCGNYGFYVVYGICFVENEGDSEATWPLLPYQATKTEWENWFRRGLARGRCLCHIRFCGKRASGPSPSMAMCLSWMYGHPMIHGIACRGQRERE